MGKGKKKAGKSRRASDTPVYDQLVADLGFAPHRLPPTGGWRNHPATAGLLEDNFS